MEEVRPLWRELGNLPMLADNLGRSARILFALGEYERALQASEESYRISRSAGNLWGQSFCRMFVGYIYLERGQVARAIEIMQECIRLGEQAGFLMVQVGTRADLGWIYGTLGAIDRGLELAHLARATAEGRFPGFRPWALAGLARLQVMRSDLAEAEAAVRRGHLDLDLNDFASHAGIEMPLAEAELAMAKQEYERAVTVMDDLLIRLKAVGMRAFRADALCLKGKALLAQGRVDEAHETLRSAQTEAEALGSRRMLWPILAALAQLEAQCGSAVESERLHQQARQIIDYIADHCPPNLRVSFLNLPDVRDVTDETSRVI